MAVNLDNVKWIKPLLLNKWANLVENKGADLDNNGKIENEEQFKDFNNNGVVGDDEDFLYYLELNAKVLAKEIAFVDVGISWTPDNPIHSRLADKPLSKAKEIYTIAKTVRDDLADELSEQKLFAEMQKYSKLSLADKEIVIEAIAYYFEVPAENLIFSLSKQYFNQAVDLYNQKKYAECLPSLDSAAELANSLLEKKTEVVSSKKVTKFSGDIYALQMEALGRLNKYEDALKSFTKALSLYADQGEQSGLYLTLIDLQLKNKRYAEAMLSCEELLKLDPDRNIKAEANMRKSFIFMVKAQEQLDQVKEQGKKYAELISFYNSGEDQLNKANEVLTLALEQYIAVENKNTCQQQINSNNYNLGVISFKKAILVYNTANENYDSGYFNVALDQYKEAEQIFQQAIGSFSKAAAGYKEGKDFQKCDAMIKDINKILDGELKASKESTAKKLGK